MFLSKVHKFCLLLPVDDVIDETYGVAVVFHEDEEEVCVCVSVCL